MKKVNFLNDLFDTQIKIVEEDRYVTIHQKDKTMDTYSKVLLNNDEIVSLYREIFKKKSILNSETDRRTFTQALDLLAKSLNFMLNSDGKKDFLEVLEQSGLEFRICSECGNLMWKGYCIEGGEDYYCSDECLDKNINPEEFEKLYDDGNGETYYTEWN